MRSRLRFLMLSLALVAVFPAFGVGAPPSTFEPASVLIFPLYDAGPASQTAITVTNTCLSDDECPGDPGPLEGEVLAAFVYVDPERNVVFERPELLTPRDTLTVFASQHNPEARRGYVLVIARNPSTFPDAGENVAFDWLVGSALVAQADRDAVWSYRACPFLAADGVDDLCDRRVTDLDGDGAPDFDGIEYVGFPREVIVPAFFEESGPFENSLVLVSTLPSDRRPEIRYELRNNRGILWADDVVLDENWWLGSLAEIAPQATDVGGDVIELGRPPVVTGWLTLYGRRAFDPSGNPDENLVPPILGVFRERVRSRGFETGHALVGRGEMDGLEGPFGNQQ